MRQGVTTTNHPRLGETRPRYGVTLIELLIVMLIITILASLILGVAAVAGETARESQSRLTVLRLHKLLMNHYDTYKTRRVKVRQEVIDGIDKQLQLKQITPAQAGQLKAKARLYALRELMIMEMPDRWGDVTLSNDLQVRYPYFLDVSETGVGRTALSSIYLRRLQQYAASADIKTLATNQGAECLYLIITLATGDGEARTQFGEASIGDTDGDGAFEFLDGWDRPINFLRSAPGFDSQVQISANMLDNPPSGTTVDQAWTAAGSGDHDPFDIYRVEPKAFRLVPLIFSAGRDNAYGIRTIDDYVPLLEKSLANLGTTPPVNPNDWPVRAPYITVPQGGVTSYLGTSTDTAATESTDNVHNHLLGRR